MKDDKSVQIPLSVNGIDKRETHAQLAALCYQRVDNKTKILLITSRRSKRWIIPKGWPEWGVSPGAVAAQEAYEEAGVKGQVYDTPLGVYSYIKVRKKAGDIPCLAVVYPLQVNYIYDDYPEKDQRNREWFSKAQAAKMVNIPELQHLILTFKPKLLSV